MHLLIFEKLSGIHAPPEFFGSQEIILFAMLLSRTRSAVVALQEIPNPDGQPIIAG